MKEETRILYCLDQIDSYFIEEAAPKKRVTRKFGLIKYGSIAASICIIAAVAVLMVGKFGEKAPTIENPSVKTEGIANKTDDTMIITSFGDKNTASSYKSPALGEYFCFTEVNDAVAANSGNPDTKYILKVEMFGANGLATDQEKNDEYKRLTKLGYEFHSVPILEYGIDGDGQMHEKAVIIGLFTAAELKSFPASESYGYTFDFVYNGDGSSVDGKMMSKPLFADGK